MNILEIKDVTYNYSNSREKVLSSVNQKFELGQFYAIIGKSGAGKSTLLSLLAGLDKPQKGKILFKNEDIEKTGYTNHRKNNISLVFQNYNLIDYLTPLENIRLVNKKASKEILLELGLNENQINKIIRWTTTKSSYCKSISLRSTSNFSRRAYWKPWQWHSWWNNRNIKKIS